MPSAASADDYVTLIIFAAITGQSRYERLLAGAHVANTLDLVELGLECPLVDQVVVASNDVTLARALAGYDRVAVEMDTPGQAFHFGRRLLELVDKHHVRRPLYFGASSAPLLAPESLEEICSDLLRAERTVISNNIWSSDFFGVTPVEALRRIELPADQDNSVPFLLTRQGGLTGEQLVPAIENLFDVDTPVDLAVHHLQANVKRHARAYLDGLDLDTSVLEAAMPRLISLRSTVALCGRVKTDLWGQPGSDIPAAKRIYAEERSMKSTGRDARGEVRSIFGYLLEAVGPERLFAHLAEMADAIFLDSRVLFAHLRLNLPAADRFASDARDVTAIANPTARAITAAACACPVPVVLGGHNIVSGALWALTQEAWNRADAGQLTLL